MTKHYCALGLGLAKIRFRSNVFSSKCGRVKPFISLNESILS